MNNQYNSIVECIESRLFPQNDKSSKKVHINNADVFLSTSLGNERKRNEDRVVFALVKNQSMSGTNLAIGVLADGMGGMKEGDKAASVTIAAFLTYLATGEPGKGLKDLCRRAVGYAHKMSIEKVGKKAGSTLSAIVYGKKGCIGINAGDSRIYYYDRFKGAEQITTDDTIAAQLGESYEKDNEWFYLNGGDHRLVQHIGMEGDLEPHVKDLSLECNADIKGTGFLLTSDGLHFIGKKMLSRIIKNSSSDSELSKRLTSIAEWLGGHDNLSLVVLPRYVNLSELGGNEKDTVIRVYTPEAEFDTILQETNKFKEGKKESIEQQQKLFSDDKISKTNENESTKKADVEEKNYVNNEKQSTGKKESVKGGKKVAAKKASSKKAKPKKKKAKSKKDKEVNEEKIEVKIDFIDVDDESGENNEI